MVKPPPCITDNQEWMGTHWLGRDIPAGQRLDYHWKKKDPVVRERLMGSLKPLGISEAQDKAV